MDAFSSKEDRRMTVIVVDCSNRSLALSEPSLGLAPQMEPVSVSG